jgi:hypothetical protein
VAVTGSAGREVKNSFIARADAESGDNLFAPESGAGEYFAYYLPLNEPPRGRRSGTKAEVERLRERHRAPYLLFPEDRRFPIRICDTLPSRWIETGPNTLVQGQAYRGEFSVFQVGVYAQPGLARGRDRNNRFSSYTGIRFGMVNPRVGAGAGATSVWR